MLEEILKNINTNLERIVDALNNKNLVMHKAEVVEPDSPIPNVISDITPAQNQVNISANAVNTQATPQVVPTQTVIPATPQAETFTQEQLARAMSNAVSAGKMNVITGILGQFNVQALTQIDPKDYNKLAVMLREAGVTI